MAAVGALQLAPVERLQVPQPVARPGGGAHAVAQLLRPRRVPEQGLAADVLEPLPLHQGGVLEVPRRRQVVHAVLGRGHQRKVRDRLGVVQAVAAHHQPQVHRHVAAVVVGGAVPLPVQPDDHVAAVPQRRAEVDLLAAGKRLPVGARGNGVAPQPQARSLDPVLEVVGEVGHQLARRAEVAAAVAAQEVAAIERGAAGRFAARRAGAGVKLLPTQAVGREQRRERGGAVLDLDHRLEAPRGVGIVGVVVHHAGHDALLTAEHVHQVVARGAAVLHQPQVRFFPVVPVAARGQAHALVPAVVVPLPQIPHPQLAADPEHGAVVDDALAVGRARRSRRDHDAGTVHRRPVALQMEPHAVAKRQRVIVEREQHDPLAIDLPGVSQRAHQSRSGALRNLRQ